MRAEDMLKNKESKSVKENRIDRDNAVNEKEYSEGMSDDFEDYFSGGGMDDSIDFGDDNIGSTDFNTSQSSGMGQSMNMNMGMGQGMGMNIGTSPYQQQLQQQRGEMQQELSNLAYKTLIEFIKGAFSFIKELIKGSKGLSARFYTKFGARLIQMSMVYGVIGIVLVICKESAKYDFFISGILLCITGTALLMFNYDRAKNENIDIGNSYEQPVEESEFEDGIEFEDSYSECYDSDSDDFNPDDFEDEEVPIDTEESTGFDFESYTSTEDTNDYDELLDSVNVSKGVYTREYLYEKIVSALMRITPEYDKFTDIDEDSEVFDKLNDIVVQASKMVVSGKDDIPYLISASENLQFVKLTIKRTKGLRNTKDFCDEIANIFKVDEEEGIIPEENEVIYATSLTVGDRIIVRVFKGDTSMVSVRDIVEKEKDFFLDSENKMPCVLGLDNNGKAVVRDFKDIESILITGFPRSGKTWFVLSLLLQLCMWNSPRDIQIIICDPKNKMSDFKNFRLPHVIKFATTDEDIVKEMRYLVREEADRRSNIIGDANKVNIWDFKKKQPDIDLPIIYVVVDEVVTLADRMEPEVKKEFQGYLRELITRLPASGIRAFLLPHTTKNDIINKTASSSIQCRISVNGDSDHIAHNLGVKNFPFLLKRKGDMAVKLPDCDAKFIRAAVVSNDNDKNSELFEYLRKLWSKLEPDCTSNVSKSADEDEKIDELLKQELDELDDFFEK